MNAVSICLNIATLLIFFMGAVVAAMVSPYLMIANFAVCLLLITISKCIQQKSRKAAWSGVAVMGMLTFSMFFPIGIAGLVGAYRSRAEWTAW
jgi:energy-coupling factor transporter transmembrane protein EcfT